MAGAASCPDVFVPADTTDVTKYFIEVAGRNILYRYTIEYADRRRDALNAVRTIGGLDSLLDGDRRLFDDFIALCGRQGRRAALRRYRPLAQTHRGATEGLHRGATRRSRTTDSMRKSTPWTT